MNRGNGSPRAGLGSNLAGSVLFKALLDILVVPVQRLGRGDVRNTGTGAAFTGAEAGTISVVPPALTPLVNPGRAPCDRSGAPTDSKPQ